jgi:hypothetical protein
VRPCSSSGSRFHIECCVPINRACGLARYRIKFAHTAKYNSIPHEHPLPTRLQLPPNLECAPRSGQGYAAVLTVCRAWWSSN